MSAMIEETATVVRVAEGDAWVSVRTRSACSHCGTSSDCGTAMVSRLFGEKENLLRLPDTLGVAPGEQVVIGVSNALLLKASLLAYIAPLLGFIAAMIIGQGVGMGEEASGIFGLAGLGIGLWLVNCVTGGSDARKNYCPVMLKRAGTHYVPVNTVFDTGVES